MNLRSAAIGLVRELRTKKLRTALTVFGITWGTVAVVLLLAFGTGVKAFTLERQKGLGDGIVIVWPSRTTKPFEGFGKGRLIRLKADDVLHLTAEIPDLEAVSPEYAGTASIVCGPVKRKIVLCGVYPAYEQLRNTYPAPGGRFVNHLDVSDRRRVLVLGDLKKVELFGDGDALGERVLINGTPFTVVGVLAPKLQDSSYLGRDQNLGFIPATTFATLFGRSHVDNFVWRAADPRDHEAALHKTYEVLGRICRFDSSDTEALQCWDVTDQMRFFFYFFFGFNLFLGVSGTFTLLVGGVGVANIMYMILRSRTREIGIQMALGAKPRDILLQFLMQALLLTAMGGVLGFLLSWGLAELIAVTPAADQIGRPRISPFVSLLAVTLLGAVGFLAGFFPAHRAASVDPVRALGYARG